MLHRNSFFANTAAILESIRTVSLNNFLLGDCGTFNTFKRHIESVKEKAGELDVDCFEPKLLCVARLTRGINYCLKYLLTGH